MTKSETLIEAVMTSLAGTAGVDDRIYRSRVEALSSAEHPAILVEPLTNTPTRGSIRRLSWDLVFQVIIFVRADVPDQTGDPILEDAHSKIMTLQAASGVSDLLPTSQDWEFFKSDVPLGIITLQYKLTYQTSETDLASL